MKYCNNFDAMSKTSIYVVAEISPEEIKMLAS